MAPGAIEETMNDEFVPVAFDDIADDVRRHLAVLPSAIDSFLEEHILASAHYRVVVGGEAAGFASIHDGSLITQFALATPYRREGQRLFARLRRLEQVRSAFVPTCDEFSLSHALDDSRRLARQAYFFTALDQPAESASPRDFALRLASKADAALVREAAGDFFAAPEAQIEAGELFVTLRAGEPVGFGVLERNRLCDAVASIGMYTFDRCRRQGVGTATIALLRNVCQDRGLRPVAGCWYYNHRSRQTLERAGMYAATRLLKFDY
jgi:GNAT superfamily N-acetyltransferase